MRLQPPFYSQFRHNADSAPTGQGRACGQTAALSFRLRGHNIGPTRRAALRREGGADLESLPMTPPDEESTSFQAELLELQVEHRDLDQAIATLTLNPSPDELVLRRLKKRKLQLKDRIVLLERMLDPDILA